MFERNSEGKSDNTYKLLFRKSEYPCDSYVADLRVSVEDRIVKLQYVPPMRTHISRDSPFQEREVHAGNADAIYHLSPGSTPLKNDTPVTDDDRGPSRPFYVLVNNLRSDNLRWILPRALLLQCEVRSAVRGKVFSANSCRLCLLEILAILV